MADRYFTDNVDGFPLWDEKIGRRIGSGQSADDAKRIVAALNAQDKLAKLIWGPEGCPEWLKDA